MLLVNKIKELFKNDKIINDQCSSSYHGTECLAYRRG